MAPWTSFSFISYNGEKYNGEDSRMLYGISDDFDNERASNPSSTILISYVVAAPGDPILSFCWGGKLTEPINIPVEQGCLSPRRNENLLSNTL